LSLIKLTLNFKLKWRRTFNTIVVLKVTKKHHTT